VVRLPKTEPQHLAAVLQAVLALQQQHALEPWRQLPWQQQQGGEQQQLAPKGLTDVERSRNTFRPSAVLTTAQTAAAAGAAAGASSSDGSSSSSDNSSVWRLLTTTSKAAAATQGSAAPVKQQQQPAVAAVPALGALGMLLGQRRALHTLPSGTLQHLQSQQQQHAALFEAQLDLAGLPVVQHSCCLLPGVGAEQLHVCGGERRRMLICCGSVACL
jgi:hypothetical protein